MGLILTKKHLTAFHNHLLREEKSCHTIEKYLRDAGAFVLYAARRELTKELTVAYKKSLETAYAVSSKHVFEFHHGRTVRYTNSQRKKQLRSGSIDAFKPIFGNFISQLFLRYKRHR